MNHCIPSFDVDEDYSSTSASHLNRATLEDNGIVELMWQNGQVVMQSQKSVKKSAAADFNEDELNISSRCEIHNQSQQQQQQYLFMKEDEMASWLHYPLNHAAFDSDFCSDLLYSSVPCVNATATETEAPTSKITTNTTATQTASTHHAAQLAEQSKAKVSPRHPITPSRRLDNFDYQSSLSKSRVAESVLSGSNRAANEFTVVDFNETPVAPPKSRVSEPAHQEMAAHGTIARAASLSTSSSGAGKDAAACQMILTSTSPGTSSASPELSPELRPPPAAPSKDRKRKGRLFEDTEMESPGVKKHARGLTSVKRSRAAEVHNLSERRRRDRINEKMRTLQELVPHCNKVDKASMLDEAIEYLKSLQMQVQGMSMGCSMVPMMFPGVQQYVPPHPHMAAAMAMAAVGMNRPMMPFPNNMPGGSLPIAGAGPHLGSRFPLPATPNSNSTNPVMDSSFLMQNPNQPTNFVNPYRQYLSLMRFQTQQQNQAVDHQGSSKYGTSKGVEHLERHPTG